MNTLEGKTLLITGASRGIGAAIALRAAQDHANVVIAAKSDRPHPKLPGTIHSVAESVEKAGGQALPLRLDIRDEDAVQQAVSSAAEAFGGIDILVNNASAIWLSPTVETPTKRLDLMWEVNARGTFICSKACIPWLEKAKNPHILNLSPPPQLKEEWFKNHVAYTLSKYAMSLYAFGMAAELRNVGIAVNTLWPRTVIATAALNMLGGRISAEQCRKPQIVADAAHHILTQPARQCTGHHFIDEEVLRAAGITDLDRYAVHPGAPLAHDLFTEPY